jgi:hypothetical protein
VRPLRTFETVEIETPASAAIPVSVLRPGSRRIGNSFQKKSGPFEKSGGPESPSKPEEHKKSR